MPDKKLKPSTGYNDAGAEVAAREMTSIFNPNYNIEDAAEGKNQGKYLKDISSIEDIKEARQLLKKVGDE